jgi:hypothetical protein
MNRSPPVLSFVGLFGRTSVSPAAQFEVIAVISRIPLLYIAPRVSSLAARTEGARMFPGMNSGGTGRSQLTKALMATRSKVHEVKVHLVGFVKPDPVKRHKLVFAVWPHFKLELWAPVWRISATNLRQDAFAALPERAAVDNRTEAKFTLWLMCLRYRLLVKYDNIYRIGGSNHAL